MLASAYENSLRVAEANGLRSIAFPAISTGIYGFPISHAAPIAAGTVRGYLAQHPAIERVMLICFDAETYEATRLACATFTQKSPSS